MGSAIIFHLLILMLLPASITSFSVSVYDNVIAPSTCQTLHKLTLEHTRRSHDGSSLFYRGPKIHSGQQKLTPIENALDSILRQLNDTSPMVEYWSRSQYINLDAHADIDENTLKDEGVLRCPRHGHVLYLQIANSDVNSDESTEGHENSGESSSAATISEQEKHSRMGPTVVFNRKVAWGSVTPRTIQSVQTQDDDIGVASHNSPENMKERVQEYIVDVENYWDEETKRQYGLLGNDNEDNAHDDEDEEKMAIVPAVNGRLLRFDGAAFHCVPKPPDRFLLSDDELTAFLEKDCEEDCEDDDDVYYWDDEDDDDLEKEDLSQQRSVILFNTWPAGSYGPRGVLPDCVVEAVPDGIVLDDDNSASLDDERIAEQWKKWQDEYGPNSEKLHCNPAEDWNFCIVDNLDGDETSDVTIPLMGNPTRRGCIQSKAVMQGQGLSNRIENAFYDGRKVSMTTLKELPKQR
ncbi:hypothetical protein ACHAWT_005008 [Skeletonema menzelii]